MKIEVYKKNVEKETYSRGYALDFVARHKNIFADRVTKRVVLDCPSIIKEISKKDNLKTVWYWGFIIDRYIIIQNAKNDKEAIDYIYTEYRKIKEGGKNE